MPCCRCESKRVLVGSDHGRPFIRFTLDGHLSSARTVPPFVECSIFLDLENHSFLRSLQKSLLTLLAKIKHHKCSKDVRLDSTNVAMTCLGSRCGAISMR